MRAHPQKAFTLIELLVVIAIIAILSVVVIVTLNPSDLLRQSRDSSRLSDLATMNTAIGVFTAQGGTNLGTANTIYVSIPDPAATSSAGDQCQGLGLPSAPSGTVYACAASSTYRNVNGSGWIPVNFSSISIGSPLGALPQDPSNTTSSENYYTYTTNGTQFIVTALAESQKNKTSLGLNPQIASYPEVMAQGSNLTIAPLWNPNGLAAYWTLNEGSGSSSIDSSGNANTGSWQGASGGSGGTHYVGGKVGSWAGSFDGSTNNITTANSTSGPQQYSLGVWFKTTTGNGGALMGFGNTSACLGDSSYDRELYLDNAGQVLFGNGAVVSPASYNDGNWHYAAGAMSNVLESLYIDGNLVATSSNTSTQAYSGWWHIGCNSLSGWPSAPSDWSFTGSEDDARVYNRALSSAEVQSYYQATK